MPTVLKKCEVKKNKTMPALFKLLVNAEIKRNRHGENVALYVHKKIIETVGRPIATQHASDFQKFRHINCIADTRSPTYVFDP
jgi:hypothetical protein